MMPCRKAAVWIILPDTSVFSRASPTHYNVQIQHNINYHMTMATKPETAESGATPSQSSAESLSTEHLYYDDTELYTNTGHVTAEWDTEMNGEKLISLVLDRTVMHPQGGTCMCEGKRRRIILVYSRERK